MSDFDSNLFFRYLDLLRENKDKQYFDAFSNLQKTKFCAMGGLRHLVTSTESFLKVREQFSFAVLYPLGLKPAQIIRWNDRDRLTFLQIADKLEAIAVKEKLIPPVKYVVIDSSYPAIIEGSGAFENNEFYSFGEALDYLSDWLGDSLEFALPTNHGQKRLYFLGDYVEIRRVEG
jgi:hypothetical protein